MSGALSYFVTLASGCEVIIAWTLPWSLFLGKGELINTGMLFLYEVLTKLNILQIFLKV